MEGKKAARCPAVVPNRIARWVTDTHAVPVTHLPQGVSFVRLHKIYRDSFIPFLFNLEFYLVLQFDP